MQEAGHARAALLTAKTSAFAAALSASRSARESYTSPPTKLLTVSRLPGGTEAVSDKQSLIDILHGSAALSKGQYVNVRGACRGQHTSHAALQDCRGRPINDLARLHAQAMRQLSPRLRDCCCQRSLQLCCHPVPLRHSSATAIRFKSCGIVASSWRIWQESAGRILKGGKLPCSPAWEHPRRMAAPPLLADPCRVPAPKRQQ